MKKKYIVILVIILLIILGIVGWFVYQQIKENGRQYEIEKLSIDNYQYFILRQDGNYGVINKNGDIVINPEYTNIVIPNPEKEVFICYTGEETKILNQNQEQIYAQYSHIQPIKLKNIASDLMYEKNVLTYEQDGKIGLINLEGEIIAKPIYESIEGLPYKEGELLVKIDGKYGVINNKGNELVKAEYDQISPDNYTTEENGYKDAGYIVSNTTENGYRYGYVDVKGNMILQTEYNEISRIIDIKGNDIYLIAAQNGQYGMYKNEKQVIKNEYQSISYNSENGTVTLEKTKKLIDSSKNDLDALVWMMTDVSSNFNKLAVNINGIITDEKFKPTMYETAEAISNMSKQLAPIIGSINAEEFAEDLNSIMKNLNELSTTVNRMSKDEKLKKKFVDSVDNFNATMCQVNTALETINGEDNEENLKQIVEDTSDTIANLKKFSEKLNKRFLLFRLMF